MPNPKLIIKHNDSLETYNDRLRVNISGKSGNTLERRPDGLYAEALPGKDGSSGTGYHDGYQSNNILISGVTSYDNLTPSAGRIAAHPITHRIFTATDQNGSTLINFRNGIDTIYPGDMFRYHDDVHKCWVYKIILRTNGSSVTEKSGIVAVIPDSYSNIN